MNIRASVANMVFLGTPQFNGFQKVPWSLKSMYMLSWLLSFLSSSLSSSFVLHRRNLKISDMHMLS